MEREQLICTVTACRPRRKSAGGCILEKKHKAPLRYYTHNFQNVLDKFSLYKVLL